MIPSEAIIEEGYLGNWVADITVNDEPTGSFDLGQRTWVGSLTPTGAIADGSQWHARVVGGRGKLGTVLPYKNYSGGITYGQVFRDIVRAAGEQIGKIDAPGRAPYYERAKGTASECLLELAIASGLNWWVSRDGLVNISTARTESGAVDKDKAPQLRGEVDSVLLSVFEADDVAPGKVAASHTIKAIRWHMKSRLTAECSFQQISVTTSNGFYQKTYSAKVRRQNGNHSVDVIVDGKLEMSGVPLMPGVAGAVPIMKEGDLVTVGFLGWNRSTPYAVPGQLGSDSAKSVALQGDSVLFTFPPLAFVGTVGGVPTTGVMTSLTGQTLGSIQGPCSTRLKID